VRVVPCQWQTLISPSGKFPVPLNRDCCCYLSPFGISFVGLYSPSTRRYYMLTKPKILFIVAILTGIVLSGSTVWAQGTVRPAKGFGAPPNPTLPVGRYVAIAPPAGENSAAAWCIWVLDTFTGQIQAYKIAPRSGVWYVERLPNSTELPAPSP
jgi:hypothetical protein